MLPRRDASRHFKNRKKAYLKAKFEELESNSKIHNVSDFYRGFSDYKKGYHPRNNIVKDENVDCLPTPTILWGGGRTISLSY
jgi:hypothetical protein